MKVFVLLMTISAIIGIMDLIKFHWEMSVFSKVKSPAWLSRWLNPHDRLIEKAPAIFVWLLEHQLAGLNDFWHFLKFILIQLIILLGWWFHYEGDWWAFFLMGNAIYGVIFELFYSAVFTKNQ